MHPRPDHVLHRVGIVGLGLIGGSVGRALRVRGVHVRGWDRDRTVGSRAVEVGAVDELAASAGGTAQGVDLVVVAVPVSAVPEVVVEVLDAGAPVVTDVGSVKAPLVAAVERARPDRALRYVGGHPMAGSEQEGVGGADPDLFVGAAWVLTPTATTDAAAFAVARSLAVTVEAEAVAVSAEHHDRLVALVSHVPQLAASTLMELADRSGEERRVLLRLAAGGFRDMTRIAAGHPGIWPDIFAANRDAVLEALDRYVAALRDVRGMVERGDREALLAVLDRARSARSNLPVGVPVAEGLVELRIRVPDRPGVLAEVTTLAGSLGVNVVDLEIAHSLEGAAGVLVLVVSADGAEALEKGLADLGYHVARTPLP